jgi:transglutaminase-like putative cysteine protease
MYYAIRHVTEFDYSAPITESVMEVHMQPRTDEWQRCLSFTLDVTPRTHVQHHRDYLGNIIHHFDIPESHWRLVLLAEAQVEMLIPSPLPEALTPSAWDELDVLLDNGDVWEWLVPSYFAQPTALLHDLATELNAARRDDPLTVLRQINTGINQAFTYQPQSTEVDSPIDDALKARQGVCQDYAHIMIALARELRIPCRYVSGYLFHHVDDYSDPAASHAWLEALLPGLGWVGFDPTNNVVASDRHIRVAIGRDYADVPPTRGVFKGLASSTLQVGVRVLPADQFSPDEDFPSEIRVTPPESQSPPDFDWMEQQQQQQQQ